MSYSERLLLLSDGSACGIFPSHSQKEYMCIVLSPGGDLVLLRDSQAPVSTTHLTRYVPRRYKQVVGTVLEFRNAHSSTPYCCTYFHGDKIHMGTPETLWPQTSISGDNIRVRSDRGDCEVHLCGSKRRVFLKIPVLFPGEFVDRRASQFDIPRATSVIFSWPICRAPSDVLQLICATVDAPRPTNEAESKEIDYIVSRHPYTSRAGTRVDVAADIFRELDAELPVLLDATVYPAMHAVVTERLDGVLYLYSGQADDVNVLKSTLLSRWYDNDMLSCDTWGVEAWVQGPDRSLQGVLSLSGQVLSYHTAEVTGGERHNRNVHVSVLGAISALAYDHESDRGVSSTLGGIDWIVSHRAAATRLVLLQEHLVPYMNGTMSFGRLGDLGLCGGEDVSPVISKSSYDHIIHGDMSIQEKASHGKTKNPADFFDNYTTALHNRMKSYYSDGHSMRPALGSPFNPSGTSCPVLESTRCDAYALTVYVNGGMHGIFADYTVIDMAPNSEVFHCI